MVSPASGQILLVAKGKDIKKGEALALIKNNSDFEQVHNLKKLLPQDTSEIALLNWIKIFRPEPFHKLGEMADAYNKLLLELESFKLFLLFDKSREEIIAYEKQLDVQLNLLKNQNYLENIANEKYIISEKHLQSDSLLYVNNAVTKSTITQSYITFLNAQSEKFSNNNTLVRLQDAVRNIKLNSLLKSTLYQRNYRQHLMNISQKLNELLSKIYIWEQHYIVTSPIDGKFEEFGFLRNHFFANAGQQLFSIIPNKQNFYAVVNMPAQGAGKVKIGMKVHLKLNDYPYDEFGIIKGRVAKISSVTQELMNRSDPNIVGIYTVIVEIESNTSTFDKAIIFKNQMPALAEIITKNRSILSRVFDKIQSVFE